MLAVLVALASGVVEVGCRSSAPPAEGPPVRHTYPPVPGEAFLRAERRVLLAREVRMELPLHLEAELFLAGNEMKRWTADGKKMKAAYGLARAKFAEGLEIREAEHILVVFPPDGDRVRLEARGAVVFLDVADNRRVTHAVGMELGGNTAVFRGDYREEPLQ